VSVVITRSEEGACMELTNKEKRLIMRRRKIWHKISRRIIYGVTAFCTMLFVVYAVYAYGKVKEQLAYQDVVNAIPASAHTDGPPAFTIMVSQYIQQEGNTDNESEESRLVEDHFGLYQHVLDSLGLLSKGLGFKLAITVVPFNSHGMRRVKSQLGWYSTSCGCEKDTLDFIQMSIDSTDNVVVISSQLVATTNIQP